MKIKKDDAGYAMSQAKKLAGEFGKFYTPESVCRFLAKLARVENVETVYDPTCGTGSLLLYAYDEYGKNVKLYGQEIVPESAELARENMIANGVERFEIAEGDTLAKPAFDIQFDVILGNPPFSVKWEPFEDERFKPCPAPRGKADWAFIQHSFHFLKPTGKMAFVVSPGILYRSGAEATIRDWFVKNGHIESVIQLPSNLFEATSISTCAVVFSKKKTENAEVVSDLLF